MTSSNAVITIKEKPLKTLFTLNQNSTFKEIKDTLEQWYLYLDEIVSEDLLENETTTSEINNYAISFSNPIKNVIFDSPSIFTVFSGKNSFQENPYGSKITLNYNVDFDSSTKNSSTREFQATNYGHDDIVQIKLNVPSGNNNTFLSKFPTIFNATTSYLNNLTNKPGFYGFLNFKLQDIPQENGKTIVDITSNNQQTQKLSPFNSKASQTFDNSTFIPEASSIGTTTITVDHGINLDDNKTGNTSFKVPPDHSNIVLFCCFIPTKLQRTDPESWNRLVAFINQEKEVIPILVGKGVINDTQEEYICFPLDYLHIRRVFPHVVAKVSDSINYRDIEKIYTTDDAKNTLICSSWNDTPPMKPSVGFDLNTKQKIPHLPLRESVQSHPLLKKKPYWIKLVTISETYLHWQERIKKELAEIPSKISKLDAELQLLNILVSTDSTINTRIVELNKKIKDLEDKEKKLATNDLDVENKLKEIKLQNCQESHYEHYLLDPDEDLTVEGAFKEGTFALVVNSGFYTCAFIVIHVLQDVDVKGGNEPNLLFKPDAQFIERTLNSNPNTTLNDILPNSSLKTTGLINPYVDNLYDGIHRVWIKSLKTTPRYSAIVASQFLEVPLLTILKHKPSLMFLLEMRHSHAGFVRFDSIKQGEEVTEFKNPLTEGSYFISAFKPTILGLYTSKIKCIIDMSNTTKDLQAFTTFPLTLDVKLNFLQDGMEDTFAVTNLDDISKNIFHYLQMSCSIEFWNILKFIPEFSPQSIQSTIQRSIKSGKFTLEGSPFDCVKTKNVRLNLNSILQEGFQYHNSNKNKIGTSIIEKLLTLDNVTPLLSTPFYENLSTGGIESNILAVKTYTPTESSLITLYQLLYISLRLLKSNDNSNYVSSTNQILKKDYDYAKSDSKNSLFIEDDVTYYSEELILKKVLSTWTDILPSLNKAPSTDKADFQNYVSTFSPFSSERTLDPSFPGLKLAVPFFSFNSALGNIYDVDKRDLIKKSYTMLGFLTFIKCYLPLFGNFIETYARAEIDASPVFSNNKKAKLLTLFTDNTKWLVKDMTSNKKSLFSVLASKWLMSGISLILNPQYGTFTQFTEKFFNNTLSKTTFEEKANAINSISTISTSTVDNLFKTYFSHTSNTSLTYFHFMPLIFTTIKNEINTNKDIVNSIQSNGIPEIIFSVNVNAKDLSFGKKYDLNSFQKERDFGKITWNVNGNEWYKPPSSQTYQSYLTRENQIHMFLSDLSKNGGEKKFYNPFIKVLMDQIQALERMTSNYHQKGIRVQVSLNNLSYNLPKTLLEQMQLLLTTIQRNNVVYEDMMGISWSNYIAQNLKNKEFVKLLYRNSYDCLKIPIIKVCNMTQFPERTKLLTKYLSRFFVMLVTTFHRRSSSLKSIIEGHFANSPKINLPLSMNNILRGDISYWLTYSKTKTLNPTEISISIPSELIMRLLWDVVIRIIEGIFEVSRTVLGHNELRNIFETYTMNQFLEFNQNFPNIGVSDYIRSFQYSFEQHSGLIWMFHGILDGSFKYKLESIPKSQIFSGFEKKPVYVYTLSLPQSEYSTKSSSFAFLSPNSFSNTSTIYYSSNGKILPNIFHVVKDTLEYAKNTSSFIEWYYIEKVDSESNAYQQRDEIRVYITFASRVISSDNSKSLVTSFRPSIDNHLEDFISGIFSTSASSSPFQYHHPKAMGKSFNDLQWENLFSMASFNQLSHDIVPRLREKASRNIERDSSVNKVLSFLYGISEQEIAFSGVFTEDGIRATISSSETSPQIQQMFINDRLIKKPYLSAPSSAGISNGSIIRSGYGSVSRNVMNTISLPLLEARGGTSKSKTTLPTENINNWLITKGLGSVPAKPPLPYKFQKYINHIVQNNSGAPDLTLCLTECWTSVGLVEPPETVAYYQYLTFPSCFGLSGLLPFQRMELFSLVEIVWKRYMDYVKNEWEYHLFSNKFYSQEIEMSRQNISAFISKVPEEFLVDHKLAEQISAGYLSPYSGGIITATTTATSTSSTSSATTTTTTSTTTTTTTTTSATPTFPPIALLTPFNSIDEFLYHYFDGWLVNYQQYWCEDIFPELVKISKEGIAEVDLMTAVTY
jgi:hypothetical protein